MDAQTNALDFTYVSKEHKLYLGLFQLLSHQMQLVWTTMLTALGLKQEAWMNDL